MLTRIISKYTVILVYFALLIIYDISLYIVLDEHTPIDTALLAGKVMTKELPELISLGLSGLTRHTTLMLQGLAIRLAKGEK